MTIVDCIKLVLNEARLPLTVAEIYGEIVKKNLYSFNSKAPESIVRQQLRRHCEGLSFPSAMPNKYFVLTSPTKYSLPSHLNNNFSSLTNSAVRSDRIPEENIQKFYLLHIDEIKTSILDKMLNVDPEFFEQLVLDLLLKMGYGTNGSIAKTKRGADGGIDGEIFQDKLGLDRIYTQAKRYSLKHQVGEREIRDFVGALQNISKGVFITTSTFTKNAISYSLRQQQKMIVLIDGQKLSKLMVEFELGVQRTYTYPTFRVDTDYFGEG